MTGRQNHASMINGVPHSRRAVLGAALGGIGAATLTRVSGATPGGGPARRATATASLGAKVTVESAAEIRWLPRAYGIRTSSGGPLAAKIFASFHQLVPGDSAESSGLRHSNDFGASWPTYLDGAGGPSLQLDDLSLIRLPFSTSLNSADPTKATLSLQKSTDQGDTWTVQTAHLSTPAPMAAGFKFNPRPMQLANGSLRVAMYGKYVGDTKSRVIWVGSADLGANWTTIGTVAYDPSVAGTEGFTETTAAIVADGSLLAGMRSGNNLPIYLARSTDGGVTWSTPSQLVPGSAPSGALGIEPNLHLLGNGVLVLATGRPDYRLYLSANGIGDDWQDEVFVQTNGSGYAPLVPLNDHEFLYFGDDGTKFQNPLPDPYRIWARRVTISVT